MTTADAGHRDIAAENREKLRHMAEQIASFFTSYPHDEAVRAVADHINQFWSRRMRADFLETASAMREDLHPLVRGAIIHIKPPKAA